MFIYIWLCSCTYFLELFRVESVIIKSYYQFRTLTSNIILLQNEIFITHSYNIRNLWNFKFFPLRDLRLDMANGVYRVQLSEVQKWSLCICGNEIRYDPAAGSPWTNFGPNQCRTWKLLLHWTRWRAWFVFSFHNSRRCMSWVISWWKQ